MRWLMQDTRASDHKLHASPLPYAVALENEERRRNEVTTPPVQCWMKQENESTLLYSETTGQSTCTRGREQRSGGVVNASPAGPPFPPARRSLGEEGDDTRRLRR